MSAYRPPRFSLLRYFPSGRTRTAPSARGNFRVCITGVCPGVLLAVLAALCFLSAPNARCQEKTGGIFVRVQSPDKSPLDQATVNLFTFSGAPLRTATTVGGQAVFESLPKATYVLEVTAAGYERFRQSVELSINGDEQWVYVTLTPLAGFKANSGPSGPPILAPNAQKELNKALESLRADKLDEARKHLEKVSRSASSNPDVNYLWGMYYAQSKDWAHAQAYWEKAIQFYPRHEFALAALGQLALQNA